jgi:hypothetical protein
MRFTASVEQTDVKIHVQIRLFQRCVKVSALLAVFARMALLEMPVEIALSPQVVQKKHAVSKNSIAIAALLVL